VNGLLGKRKVEPPANRFDAVRVLAAQRQQDFVGASLPDDGLGECERMPPNSAKLCLALGTLKIENDAHDLLRAARRFNTG